MFVHDKCGAFEARITVLEKIIKEVGEWKEGLNVWEGEYDVHEDDIKALEEILKKL